MYKVIKENSKIMAATVMHCGLWLGSTSDDIVYKNSTYIPSNQTSEDIAIYCVHGTADGNNAFSLLANQLIHNLPNNIISMHLIAFRHRYEGVDIENFSMQLNDKIKLNGHKKVILMGHSRGGLVCAYFAEFLAEIINVHVDSVFTIGTPFHGSYLAELPLKWASDSVNEMRPGAEFLRRLKNKIKLSSIPYHFFAAEKDLIVSLSSTLIDEQSQNLTVFDKHGHLSLMSSHRLAVSIQQLLWGITTELSLQTACQEIETYLQKFQQKSHLYSSSAKDIVFQTLIAVLKSMDNVETKAQTIGAFIDEFLNDKRQGNGRKPSEILNESLNAPFALFPLFDASSYHFICGLKIKYANVLINKMPYLLLDEFIPIERIENKEILSIKL